MSPIWQTDRGFKKMLQVRARGSSSSYLMPTFGLILNKGPVGMLAIVTDSMRDVHGGISSNAHQQLHWLYIVQTNIVADFAQNISWGLLNQWQQRCKLPCTELLLHQEGPNWVIKWTCFVLFVRTINAISCYEYEPLFCSLEHFFHDLAKKISSTFFKSSFINRDKGNKTFSIAFNARL